MLNLGVIYKLTSMLFPRVMLHRKVIHMQVWVVVVQRDGQIQVGMLVEQLKMERHRLHQRVKKK